MAPQAGFEPATDRLTADCSTTELPRNALTFERWQIANCARSGQLFFRVRQEADGNPRPVSVRLTN